MTSVTQNSTHTNGTPQAWPEVVTLAPDYAQALRVVLATQQAEHPDEAEVLSRANAVLTSGRLYPSPDGRQALVLAKDSGETYTVTMTSCTCPDTVHRGAPQCKHRWGLRLHHAVQQRLAAPPVAEPLLVPMVVNQGAIERSAQTGALMAALARAQARMENPVFDSSNPYFGSRFASLAALRNAVVPPCAAEGIAVTQLPTPFEPGVAGITTGLWHSSGQYLCSTVRLPVPPLIEKGGGEKAPGPQQYGITLTYARRYGLQALCTVAGEEDDDAEGLRSTEAHRPPAIQTPMASRPTPPPVVQGRPRQESAEPTNLYGEIVRLLTTRGWSGGTRTALATEVKQQTGLELVADQYATIVAALTTAQRAEGSAA